MLDLGLIGSLPLPGWAERVSEKSSDPQQIRALAAEFEALLLAQILKSCNPSGRGAWLGLPAEDEEEGEAGQLMIDVAQEQLARALAAAGGLGLANLILRGLERAGADEAERTTAGGLGQTRAGSR